MSLRNMGAHGASMFASARAVVEDLRKRETVADLDTLIEDAGKLVNEVRGGVALFKLAVGAAASVLVGSNMRIQGEKGQEGEGSHDGPK